MPVLIEVPNVSEASSCFLYSTSFSFHLPQEEKKKDKNVGDKIESKQIRLILLPFLEDTLRGEDAREIFTVGSLGLDQMGHVRACPSLTRDSGRHIQPCTVNEVLEPKKAHCEAEELVPPVMDITMLAASESVSAVDCRHPCLCP